MSTAWFQILEMEILLYTVERPRSWFDRMRLLSLVHFLFHLILGSSVRYFHVRITIVRSDLFGPPSNCQQPTHIYLELNNYYTYLQREPYCRCRLCNHCDQTFEPRGDWPHNCHLFQHENLRLRALDHVAPIFF